LSAHAWPEVWLADRGWTPWEATTAVNPSYYEEIGADWLYEYDRRVNRLTNRQLRAILGREPSARKRKTAGSRDFNLQILFLSVPILAVLLLALRITRRYGVILLAALRPDRSSALKITAKIATGFHRRGVQRPHRLGWVRWTEAICASVTRRPLKLESRSRRLLMVILRLVYSDQAFRRRDLRYIRLFYLKYCTGPVMGVNLPS
jgi:hypothetical protein